MNMLWDQRQAGSARAQLFQYPIYIKAHSYFLLNPDDFVMIRRQCLDSHRVDTTGDLIAIAGSQDNGSQPCSIKRRTDAGGFRPSERITPASRFDERSAMTRIFSLSPGMISRVSGVNCDMAFAALIAPMTTRPACLPRCSSHKVSGLARLHEPVPVWEPSDLDTRDHSEKF